MKSFSTRILSHRGAAASQATFRLCPVLVAMEMTSCCSTGETAQPHIEGRATAYAQLVHSAFQICDRTGKARTKQSSIQSILWTSQFFPSSFLWELSTPQNMREIVHLQAGQCGNQIGAKVDKRTYTHIRRLSCSPSLVLFARILVKICHCSVVCCEEAVLSTRTTK